MLAPTTETNNLAKALDRLLNCSDLNLDDLEPETRKTIENAETALAEYRAWAGRFLDDQIAAGPKPAKPAPLKIGIVLDGGLVQAVVSDNPEALANADILVIDYDTEGADISDLSIVLQGDRKTVAFACVHRESIERAEIDLSGVRDPTPEEIKSEFG